MRTDSLYYKIADLLGKKDLKAENLPELIANHFDEFASCIGCTVVVNILAQYECGNTILDKDILANSVGESVSNHLNLIDTEWAKYKEWVDFKNKHKENANG